MCWWEVGWLVQSPISWQVTTGSDKDSGADAAPGLNLILVRTTVKMQAPNRLSRVIRVTGGYPSASRPEYIGPCGPSDPEVSVLAVQDLDGKPVALLANYSMHYFGAGPISADYYGDFVRIVSQRLADGDPSFIAMMSHGTSGDQQWQDYANPRKSISRSKAAWPRSPSTEVKDRQRRTSMRFR